MPKPQEICTITVDGEQYSDWESVWVHQEYGTASGMFRTFRVTASEQSPPATDWSQIRITPGDWMTVELAGQLAISGYVYERQAFYDAQRHGVMLAGQSRTGDIASTSIQTTQSQGTGLSGESNVGQGGEYKGYNLQQIVNSVLGPSGILFKMMGAGGAVSKPFDRVQVTPGMSQWELIEQLGRQRGVIYTDDEQGNLVGWGGLLGNFGNAGALIEGQNIISARCTIIDLTLASQTIAIGQAPGSDENWGKSRNQMVAQAFSGFMRRFRPLAFLTDHPIGLGEMSQRANFDAGWRDSELITAEIEIYGWLNGDGALWKVMDMAHLDSPMLLMNQDLVVKAVTFMQDDAQGTRTLLELIDAKHFAGSGMTIPNTESPEQETSLPPSTPGLRYARQPRRSGTQSIQQRYSRHDNKG